MERRLRETISAASFRLTSSLASGGTFALTVGFRLAIFFGGFRPDAPAFSIANYGMATGISRSQLGWGLGRQIEGHERMIRKQAAEGGGFARLSGSGQHDHWPRLRRAFQAGFNIARNPHTQNIR
jgi:hypothetical protein